MATEGSYRLLQEVNMSPDAIDIDVLSVTKKLAIKKWLADVRDGINDALQTRYRYYHDRTPSPCCLTYCPEEVRRYFTAFVETGTRQRFLWVTVYVSTRFNVSCHKLLFGTSYATELFGRTKSFIGIIPGLPPGELRTKLYQCLKDGFLETNSPLYILRQRVTEAGFAQGIPFFDLKSNGFGGPLQARIIEEMLEGELSPRQEEYTVKEFINCRPGFDLLLHYSSKLKVSADYLILQDYSDFATMNGNPLTSEQKEWLSLYLCASPDAQMQAITILSKYLIDQAEDRSRAN